MSGLEKIGLCKSSQEVLSDTFVDINENIMCIIQHSNTFYVRYQDGNMYCLNDKVNIGIQMAITALLELQEGKINIPATNDNFYGIYIRLMIRFFTRKIERLEGYIKTNDIYCMKPSVMKF